MKISYRTAPKIWFLVVAVFTLASATGFGYLWVNSGGRIPLITSAGYRITFPVADADNLVYFADVRIAGVQVGKVIRVDNEPGRTSAPAMLTIELDEQVAPLHEGVTVQPGAKSLVEESFIGVVDGSGAEIPSGNTLRAESVVPSVQLDQVLNSFDAEARQDLGSAVRRLDSATAGRGGELDQLFTGLGGNGREGHTAVDALAAQADDLEQLAANTTVLLDALDTQNGEIAELVSNGDLLTAASADGRPDLEATMRRLPGVLDSTAIASDSLTELAGALGPVAANLDEASPPLSTALRELPAISTDLRGLLPDLDGVLDRAHATLGRVPTFGEDVRGLVPPAQIVLADVNPALAYLRPYGLDIASFFTNFGAEASRGNADGTWGRILLQGGEQSLRNYPASTNVGPLDRLNPYPEPGEAANPGRPFEGPYPRVEREGG